MHILVIMWNACRRWAAFASQHMRASIPMLRTDIVDTTINDCAMQTCVCARGHACMQCARGHARICHARTHLPQTSRASQSVSARHTTISDCAIPANIYIYIYIYTLYMCSRPISDCAIPANIRARKRPRTHACIGVPCAHAHVHHQWAHVLMLIAPCKRACVCKRPRAHASSVCPCARVLMLSTCRRRGGPLYSSDYVHGNEASECVYQCAHVLMLMRSTPAAHEQDQPERVGPPALLRAGRAPAGGAGPRRGQEAAL